MGEVAEFTGISALCEEPPTPEPVMPTDELTVEQAIELIIAYLEGKWVIVDR
jgi:adenylylsulfate kinase-like enzyme